MGLSRWLALRTCGGGPLVSWIARDLCRSNRHREGPEPPGSVPSPKIEAIFRGPLLTFPNDRRRWHHGDSPLMLTTTLLGPSSIGIQSYVCTLRLVEGKGGSERAEKYLPKYPRRSRWRRWRFFFFFFFFLGGLGCSPGPFLPLPSEPPEHRRNEFSLLLYPVSAARAPSLLSPLCRYTVITVSRRRDLPPSCHARIKARITIHDGRECVFLTIFKNNIKKHCEKPDKKHKKKPISHRCSPMFSGSGRRTKERKEEEEEEYICIYTYKKGRKRGKYHGDHLLLYIIPNVYVSTERIYPEARCLLRTMHVAVVMVSLHSPSR